MEIMPNVSMCLNSDCRSCHKCYRFKAEPRARKQPYRKFAPKEGDDRCDKFMPLYRADKGVE